MGGVMAAVESGYLKQALVASHAARRARIESGEEKVVGVNCFESAEESPLTAGDVSAVQAIDPAAESAAIASLNAWRAQRDGAAVDLALRRLTEDAKSGENLMEATLMAARAGVTTGEWSGALREVFGEYRAPTGVTGVVGIAEAGSELAQVRQDVRRTGEELGGRLRLLGRQAGPGRPLQRRRAGGGAGA